MIAAVVIIMCLMIFTIFLVMMARIAVRPKVHTVEDDLEYLRGLDCMKRESIYFENEHRVTTFDGECLWTALVPAMVESKKYVVLSHGYTSTRYGMYKYAVLWRKMGYNCVLYDNRGHGMNTPADITFGFKESRDLMTVIEDTYARYGEDISLGLHGESMGAGLQLMALKYHPKVDFIVNDCGYAEILPVIAWKAKQNFHLPEVIARMVSVFAKLCHGFRFQEVRPIDYLKENEIPICFVHGLEDTFTHVWHSQKMYEANKGYKELHLFEGADHAECIIKDTARYQKMLEDFVAKVYS